MEGVTFYFSFEPVLMQWLQSFMGPVLTAIASFFTICGEETVLIAVMGVLYWAYDKEFGKFVGTNMVVGLIANPMIKNVALRRRPYFDHPQIKCLRPVDSGADIYDIAAQGYSFPSGHSSGSAILYGSLPAYKKGSKPLLMLGILMPLLIGLSRIALGVHYPTDVLCGWLLGAAVIFLVSWLQRKIKRRWLLHLILFAVSFLGVFYCRTTDYFTGLGVMAGFFLGIHFEERFVHFENAKGVLPGALRVVIGLVLFLGLNTVLKLPFSSEFLSSATAGAYAVRAVRYGIVTFLVIGVYPLAFGRFTRKK